MNRETRTLITLFRDFHFLMAVNCALDPPLRPLSNAWLLSSLSCINEFVETKLSCVEPDHLASTLVKRPTVKYNRMQFENEIFDERCKVLHSELKINTKVGTTLHLSLIHI